MKKRNIILGLGVILACGCGGDGGDDDNNSGFTQIDRMGFPAVNTALIPSSQKDAFNQGDPSTDSQFCSTMQASIDALRAAVSSVPGFPAADGAIPSATLASIVCPDTLALNLSAPNAFPNGRRLQDDVIDFTLGVVLDRGMALSGGSGVSDGVASDSTFSTTFPFYGNPNG